MLHGKIGPSDVNRHWVYRSRKALLNIQPINRKIFFFSNELEMQTDHRKEFLKLTFWALSFIKANDVNSRNSLQLMEYLQSELESVQKRALACVFPRMPYREALERACLTSIREHHEDITKSLFRSISENQDSKLHHLIPEAYSPHYNFRRQITYNVPAAKTSVLLIRFSWSVRL